MASTEQDIYDSTRIYCPECKRPAEPGSRNRISATHVEYRCEAGHGYFSIRELSKEAVANLRLLANGDPEALDPEYGFNNDELLRLGIGYGIAGPLSAEQVQREAAEILSEMEAS